MARPVSPAPCPQMCTCTHIYIRIYVNVCVCVVCVCVCVCECARTYIYMYIKYIHSEPLAVGSPVIRSSFAFRSLAVCVYVYTYIHMHRCIQVCVHMSGRAFIQIHTYSEPSQSNNQFHYQRTISALASYKSACVYTCVHVHICT